MLYFLHSREKHALAEGISEYQNYNGFREPCSMLIKPEDHAEWVMALAVPTYPSYRTSLRKPHRSSPDHGV